MYGLNREQFIFNENDVARPVKEIIVLMSARLRSMVEKYREIFSLFPEVFWQKYVKIGIALEKGYWEFVYQLCWRLATQGIEKIKKAVQELLYHAENF